MTKPNFKQMSLKELRKYVLSHREDREAWDEYASRPRPNYILVAADTPLPEQEQILNNFIQKKTSS